MTSDLRDARPSAAPLPWWRCGPVWLVLGSLAAAIGASSAAAVVAIATGDPEVGAGARLGGALRARPAAVTADAPALQARNHAATPRP